MGIGSLSNQAASRRVGSLAGLLPAVSVVRVRSALLARYRSGAGAPPRASVSSVGLEDPADPAVDAQSLAVGDAAPLQLGADLLGHECAADADHFAALDPVGKLHCP